MLEQSRLVKSKKRGRVRTYEIAPERFKVVEDWPTARRQMWEARLDRFDHYVKRLKEKGQEFPNLRCFLEAIPMERLVWTSMLFPGFRPAVFDDIPITAVVTMESVGTGTRYVFTALHRDEADFETNKASGWQQGTEIAVDQFVSHVMSMK